MNEYLGSSGEGLDQGQFYRMLALGCFDIFVTLPINLASLILDITADGHQFTFYQGWTFIHSNWEPVLLPKSVWSTNKWTTFGIYWNQWFNPFFALAFFLLYGLTPEAKRGYRRLFNLLGRLLGSKQDDSAEEALPEAIFKSGEGTSVTITLSK